MDVEHLRKALKLTWLTYYRTNRQWLVRLGIWVSYEEARRPSASFILGTLSVAEPQLIQLLPLVVDLNANPDRIVAALGLNFNPEDELETLEKSVRAEPVMQPLPRMLLSPKQTPLQPEPLPVVEIAEPAKQAAPQAAPQVERSVKQSGKPSGRVARASQPTSQSTKPPAQQLAQPPARPPAKPPQPTRRTLDTAQLSPQELPDRI